MDQEVLYTCHRLHDGRVQVFGPVTSNGRYRRCSGRRHGTATGGPYQGAVRRFLRLFTAGLSLFVYILLFRVWLPGSG